MLAIAYLLAGLLAVLSGVYLLVGVAWALLVMGVLLLALAVLEARGAPQVQAETAEPEGGRR